MLFVYLLFFHFYLLVSTIKLLLNDFMDEKSKVNPLKFQNVKCMTNLNGPKRKKSTLYVIRSGGISLGNNNSTVFYIDTLSNNTFFKRNERGTLSWWKNSYNIIFNVRNKRDRLSNDLWHQQKFWDT